MAAPAPPPKRRKRLEAVLISEDGLAKAPPIPLSYLSAEFIELEEVILNETIRDGMHIQLALNVTQEALETLAQMLPAHINARSFGVKASPSVLIEIQKIAKMYGSEDLLDIIVILLDEASRFIERTGQPNNGTGEGSEYFIIKVEDTDMEVDSDGSEEDGQNYEKNAENGNKQNSEGNKGINRNGVNSKNRSESENESSECGDKDDETSLFRLKPIALGQKNISSKRQLDEQEADEPKSLYNDQLSSLQEKFKSNTGEVTKKEDDLERRIASLNETLSELQLKEQEVKEREDLYNEKLNSLLLRQESLKEKEKKLQILQNNIRIVEEQFSALNAIPIPSTSANHSLITESFAVSNSNNQFEERDNVGFGGSENVLEDLNNDAMGTMENILGDFNDLHNNAVVLQKKESLRFHQKDFTKNDNDPLREAKVLGSSSKPKRKRDEGSRNQEPVIKKSKIECGFCKTPFRFRSSMVRHMNTCRKNPNRTTLKHKCPELECTAANTRLNDLKKHVETSHPKTFKKWNKNLKTYIEKVRESHGNCL